MKAEDLPKVSAEDLPKVSAEQVAGFLKAAKNGDGTAQNNLGICYLKGEGVSEDMALAAGWFRKAAEQGNADAQHNLGRCYSLGWGVIEDKAEADKWFRKSVGVFRKSAEQGNAKAQYDLGRCYSIGWGVIKNETEAANWFRKAADQGNSHAIGDLSECYSLGKGVPHDPVESLRLLKLAAESGDTRSQYYIGTLYANGTDGVSKDLVAAYMWLNLSGDDGNGYYGKKFSEEMTAEQIVESQRMIKGWKPKLCTAKPLASKPEATKEVRFDTLLGYKNVVVVKVEPDGIRIRHSDGAGRIPIEKLPPEIASQFWLDGHQAARYRQETGSKERAKSEIDAALREIQTKKLIVVGHVIQIIKDDSREGILLRNAVAKSPNKVAKQVPYQVQTDGPSTMNPRRPKSFTTKYKIVMEDKILPIEDLVYVECDTSNLSEMSGPYDVSEKCIFRGAIYPCGTISYTTKSDRKKAVNAYTTSDLSAIVPTVMDE